ncbi:MAG: site-specific DNA-methyltransferase [Ferrovum sp.]|nr:site-specific DNA-methyltransferase [Ferrovum sp.]
MSKYDDLVRKLKEIFQIDRPELDFGVYRILNTRVGEINEYLEKRLKTKVQESLDHAGNAGIQHFQNELVVAERNANDLGVSPDNVPKVLELRQKLAEYRISNSDHENAVFTHLLTFFSRYYDKGDFISQRRYKGDTYAIPYAGEEVVLHWANKDQYYTKSGENFSNYGFKLDDGRTVRFRLVTADTAKDNRKDNDKERRFALIEPHTRTLTDEEGDEYEETLLPITEENSELVLRFEYKAMPKGTKQDSLVLDAVTKVLDDTIVKAKWKDLNKKEPTEKNPQRTLLEKCLTSYTTKNTADYFIHKDLGGFLRRELDFYIKNEVMHLDDVQNAEKFADIEKNLRLIQTLRAIALDLITFLAQLEDFQKKLWLKKKFVVSTHYCITLDRIPENLYPIIATNPKQWDQWEKLGMLENNKDDLFKQAIKGSVEYLKEYPFLMADTALFDVEFKYAILAAVDNLDESLDGLLIHGDNFQALNLLQERCREQVKCIYIDPPYNTSENGFIYKNQYKHSSWISMILNRVSLSVDILKPNGVLCCAIDDLELPYLENTLDMVFNFENRLGNLVIEIKPSGRTNDKYLATSHEYILFYAKDHAKADIDFFPLSDEQISQYSEGDGEKSFKWRDFLRTGGFSTPEERPNSYYLIYFNPETGKANVEPFDGAVAIEPLDSEGKKRVWRKTKPSFLAHLRLDEINFTKNRKGDWKIQIIDRIKVGIRPKSIWVESKYDASSHGTKLLKSLFGYSTDFSFPKSVHAVLDSIFLNVGSDRSATVVDFFAGSGTTGHAVINLNREDQGKRKYILVEQGEYFNTVTKPRIQKVVYSADWKDGKANAPQTGISHAFKVLKLESYEDTLNNLQLTRTEAQQNLLDDLPQSAQEDYLLRYMLDIESRGSVLSVEQFKKPFDCKLKVTMDSAGAYEEHTIDLVETFNYLIGLRVKHIDMQADMGFISITGTLPSGEKTLVLWRDVEKLDYEGLNRLCKKLAINPADSEFDVVYINGDHNIPAVFTSTEAEGGITKTLKIRQIEPEFMTRMFSVEDM